jgi:hypothetical protein
MKYVVAIYEVHQKCGGRLEQGRGLQDVKSGVWWFGSYRLRRVTAVFSSMDKTVRYANRMNRLFERQRALMGAPSFKDRTYAGGHYTVFAFVNYAPVEHGTDMLVHSHFYRRNMPDNFWLEGEQP